MTTSWLFFAADFRVNRVNYIAIADYFSSIALFDLGGKISWPKSALLVDCRWLCMAVSGCRPSHYPFVKLLATKYDPTPKSLHLGKPRVLVSTLVCQLKPVDSSWGKWMFCGAVPFWSVAQTLVSGEWSSRCCWGWGVASWPWTSIWDAQGMVRLVEALSTFMGYSMRYTPKVPKLPFVLACAFHLSKNYSDLEFTTQTLSHVDQWLEDLLECSHDNPESLADDHGTAQCLGCSKCLRSESEKPKWDV